ncbi:trypsin-like serine protease [Cohnella sp. CFH 77786]|uniref:S1C family serine protease n=1 Tax=Cohnella sp. CFH 77786 TaxID=2662265 RepID=UPI001C60F0E1|nr:trypsin-like peptidase domain-containing protein [Cohnella sp. CFH 77786]MBW5446910.1 trypsin-like serine protease [Cohnella sp. CFH 77786]
MDDQNKKPDELQGFSHNEDQTRERQTDFRTERDDPYAGIRRESEPYTFGPFGRTQPYEAGAAPGQSDPEQAEVVPASREYRPFTVSGGVRGGAWQSPPRRTSLRALFASFMVGVVVVGGLMFAADRGNWFTQETFAASSQGETAKAASVPVSNAVDTVRPNNIAKIFEQSSPAVVKIETYVKANSRRSNSQMDDLFRQFFGEDPGSGDNGGDNGSDNGGSLQESGMGSGFLFESNGYILTNQHVIADSDDIEVTVVGHNKPFKAKLLGSSYDLDLAVLKIEGTGFPTLKLGDSSSSNMGDWVIAIGNPYGFDHTVTVGVLSSNEREISIPDSQGTRNYQHLLQTDASINPGNSGGPLLNLQGEVIGINTAVSSQAQGIGFAIPTSTIKEVLDNLKSNKAIPKKPVPFIGATLMTVTPEIADKLGLSGQTGSLVRDVVYGSPAYKADLRAYDVITGMDGTDYKDNESLIAAIQKKNVGDKVKLHVIRNGQKIDITVQIGDKNQFTNNDFNQQ